MLPRQSAPVTRPFPFPTALQVVSEPELTDPTRIKRDYRVVEGANPNPNDPQRFLYPLACYQDCSILSGYSFLQCMRGCRW